MSDRHERARRAVRKAAANRDAARRELLARHRALARKRARNRARSAGGESDRSSDGAGSTGPHSTVPPTDSNPEVAAGAPASTVPERPARSEVDPRPRLYGLGLYLAARGDGGEDGG